MTITRIDSTSVRVSWTLKNGQEGVQFFLVEYYKKEDGSDKHTKNTTETEITIHGLDPDAEYEFVVSISFLPFLFFSSISFLFLECCCKQKTSILSAILGSSWNSSLYVRYPLQHTLANNVNYSNITAS